MMHLRPYVIPAVLALALAGCSWFGSSKSDYKSAQARADQGKERRWSPHLFGFGTQSLKGLASDVLHGHRDGWSPLWSPYRFSDHPPQPTQPPALPHAGSPVAATTTRARAVSNPGTATAPSDASGARGRTGRAAR